ncbi:MAG: DUF6524 family protein [Rhodospirillaceae bacterium]
MAPIRTTWGGFFWRWIIAVILVLGTFNPTPYSFLNWLTAGGGPISVKALATIVVVIVYAVYLRATWYSLGVFGTAALTAFVAAVIWVLADYGILDVARGNAVTWIVLVGIATILAIGFTWSKARARLTGQVDVDSDEH